MKKSVLEQYRQELHPLHEDFSQKLAQLFGDLMKGSDIPYALVEHRTKTVESFAEKVKRKGYANPFSEMTDLSGIRLITYYHDDVQRVASIIRKEFAVDLANSSDKIEELDVDEFGYRSLHFVVRLSECRRALPEWRKYDRLSAEIQVRSVLQHAWAAISHKLDYKRSSEAPPELRRSLFRLSALFELADDVFVSIRDRATTIQTTYMKDIRGQDLSLPINLDSIDAFLAERNLVAEWERLGLAAGFSQIDKENPSGTKARLLEALRLVGCTTIADLDALLQRLKPGAEQRLAAFSRALKKRHGKFMATCHDVISLAIYLEHPEILPNRKHPFHRKGLEPALKDIVGRA